MKVNYSVLPGSKGSHSMLVRHAEWLAGIKTCSTGQLTPENEPPAGYEKYLVVDVIGQEFAWMNENFPKDQYTWYLWYESVFLVPEEMAVFLRLKWHEDF